MKRSTLVLAVAALCVGVATTLSAQVLVPPKTAAPMNGAPGHLPVKQLPAPRPAGAAPASVAATVVSPTSVRVTWAPLAGASDYAVWRATAATGPFRLIGTVVPPAASSAKLKAGQIEKLSPYLDAGVMPKSTVYYRVTANYPALSPGVSAVVGATTPPAPQAKDFRAVAGLGSVLLAWTAPPGATGYMITRGDGTFLNNRQLIRAVTFLDIGLPLTPQTYRLVAYYKVEGVGEIEGDLTHLPTTYATPKTAGPSNFRVADYGGRALEFRWTDNPAASEYRVMRALASDGIFAIQTPSRAWSEAGERWFINETAVIGKSYYYMLVTIYPNRTAADSHILFVKKLP